MEMKTYPTETRSPTFAIDFINLLLSAGAPGVIGAKAFTLLAFVATVEDKRRFMSAPRFQKGDLSQRVGCPRHKVDEILARCVSQGWLIVQEFEQQTRESYVEAWVSVPEPFRELFLPTAPKIDGTQKVCEAQPELRKSYEALRQSMIDWERDFGPLLDAANIFDLLSFCDTDALRALVQKLGRCHLLVRPELLRCVAARCKAELESRLEESGVRHWRRLLAVATERGLSASDVGKIIDHWMTIRNEFRNPPSALYFAIDHAHPEAMSRIDAIFPRQRYSR